MAVDANGNVILANEEPVTFDERQQAKINALIQQKQGEAAREVRAELATAKAAEAALAAELATAKAALAKATPAGKGKAAEDVAELQAQVNEMKLASQSTLQELETTKRLAMDKAKEVADAKNETLKVRKEVAMHKAVGKLSFVDPAMVAKLTDDSIKWDEQKGRFVVISESGTEKLNASMEPMSLEEFYKGFATENPYLVKADARGGAGSSQSQVGLSSNGKYEVTQIFGKTSNADLANKLARENKQEYMRLRTVAKENGLI